MLIKYPAISINWYLLYIKAVIDIMVRPRDEQWSKGDTGETGTTGAATSKKYMLSTEEEGAEEHCQCGASALTNQRIFDWLDVTFGYDLSPLKEHFVDAA